MRTQYRFIHFEKTTTLFDSNSFWVKNQSNETLGIIEFYPEWSEFIYEPCTDKIVLSLKCLEDLGFFVKQLNVMYKKGEPI